MTFLAKAERLNRDQMVARIMATQYDRGYKPQFFMMHNTGVPNLTNWNRWNTTQRLAWGDNLNSYYRGMGWSSGPLACGMPEDWSYLLCDPAQHSIHCSCCNYAPRAAQGVETLGDFRTGGDDPNSTLGKASMDSTINILAALHLRNNYDPGDFILWEKGLHFHIMCHADGHACPGDRVHLPDVVARVRARMTEIHTGLKPVDVQPIPESQPAPQPVPTPQPVPLPPPTPRPPLTIQPLPNPHSPDSAQFYQRAAAVRDCFKQLSGGVSEPLCMAAVANAFADSDFDVGVGSDAARGLYQWHPDRIDIIKAGCGVDLTQSPPIPEQCRAAWWELNHTFPKALTALLACSSARTAAEIFCREYECIEDSAVVEKRGQWAEMFSSYFGHLTN